MGTHPPDELHRLWKQDKITNEQAIGYIIQNLVTMSVEDKKAGLYTYVNELLAGIRKQFNALQARVQLLEQQWGQENGKPQDE